MGPQVLAQPKEEKDGKRQQDEEYQELEHPQVSFAFPNFANQAQASEELQRTSVLPRAISSGL
ncbi:unnamed protein product [Bubo scandiacus]